MPSRARVPVSLVRHEERPAPGTVIDLHARRKRRPADEPEASSSGDALERAAAHWNGVFAAAGLDFDTPQPASVVVPLVAAELERLVGGLMFVREGGGPMNLPPNPEAGMDAASAVECAALLRELSAVVRKGRFHGGKA